MALDAKMTFDDNALFRHPDIEKLRDETEENPAELRAGKAGLSYISLTGNIGCLVNGAGLAMSTMDIIKYHGGEPANFLDVGGGVTAEGAIEAFRIILSDPQRQGRAGEHLRRHRQVRPDRRGAGEGRPRSRLQGAGGGAAGRDERRARPRDPGRGASGAADDADGDRPDRRGEEGGRGGEVRCESGSASTSQIAR